MRVIFLAFLLVGSTAFAVTEDWREGTCLDPRPQAAQTRGCHDLANLIATDSCVKSAVEMLAARSKDAFAANNLIGDSCADVMSDSSRRDGYLVNFLATIIMQRSGWDEKDVVRGTGAGVYFLNVKNTKAQRFACACEGVTEEALLKQPLVSLRCGTYAALVDLTNPTGPTDGAPVPSGVLDFPPNIANRIRSRMSHYCDRRQTPVERQMQHSEIHR